MVRSRAVIVVCTLFATASLSAMPAFASSVEQPRSAPAASVVVSPGVNPNATLIGAVRFAAFGSPSASSHDLWIGTADLSLDTNAVRSSIAFTNSTSSPASGVKSGDCLGDWDKAGANNFVMEYQPATSDRLTVTLSNSAVISDLNCSLVFNNFTAAHNITTANLIPYMNYVEVTVKRGSTSYTSTLSNLTLNDATTLGTFAPSNSSPTIKNITSFSLGNGFKLSGTLNFTGAFGSCASACAVEISFGTLPSQVTVQKTVSGLTPPTAWQFAGPKGNFSIPNIGGTTVITPLGSSTYAISETTRPGFVASTTCTNGASGGSSVSLTPDAGALITCTFSNVLTPTYSTITVKPSQPQGWAGLAEPSPGVEYAIPLDIQSPPPAPALGIANAALVLTQTNVGKLFYAPILTGTKLSDLLVLTYSTHIVDGQTPTIQIGWDDDSTDANTGWRGRLVFVPNATAGAWQTWNALSDSAGVWVTTYGTLADNSCKLNVTSGCLWSQILAKFPNAVIHPTSPLGFVGVKAGSGSTGASYFDALTIAANQNVTTYDFEPDCNPYRVFNMNSGKAFCTIQAAIDDANTVAGNTISATAGLYTEVLTITRGITLTGDPGATITPPFDMSTFASPRRGALIWVDADNVTIRNLIINGDNPSVSGGFPTAGGEMNVARAIYLRGQDTQQCRDGLRVENNIIRNAARGVNVYCGANHVIQNNQMYDLGIGANDGNYGYGVLLHETANGIVANNTITNAATAGVFLQNSYTSQPVTFTNNVITNAGIGLGVNLVYGNGNTLVQNNTVYSASLGMQVTSINIGALTVQNNTFTLTQPGDMGVLAWNISPGTTQLLTNTLSGGDVGVLLTDNDSTFGASEAISNSLVMRGNTIQNANIGVQVLAQINTAGVVLTATGNTISGSLSAGVQITGTAPVVVSATKNIIAVNANGVQNTANASNITFNRNDLSSNSASAINNSDAGSLNGECNWFGSNAGPGASVVGNVDANPWLISSDLNGDCALATLVVEKVVSGLTPPTAWQFVVPSGAFTLPAAGGTQTFSGLNFGPLVITETGKAGFVATSACTNGASGNNVITPTLLGSATVTCTFTNSITPNYITMTVKPSLMGTWAFATETANGSGTFVAGPATAPLGNGSAQMTIDANGREILYTPTFTGTRLDAITFLRYSTYVSAGNPIPTAPVLQLNVDYTVTDANNSWQGRLTFEPYMSGTVTQDTWQTWYPLQGKWYASGAPGNTMCPQGNPCTWQQVLAAFPNAGIHNVLPGVMFRAGGPWSPGFTGHVDAFTIGVGNAFNTYDFEPETPCTTVCYADAVNGNDLNGGGFITNAKKTIQAAIDTVAMSGTVRVLPGNYSEAATNRFVLGTGNGPHQFGLFFGMNKPGISVIGVDASDVPITNAAGTLANITTNATNNFGASGIFVEADNITIAGVNILPNAGGDNKTIEILGDGFTFKSAKISVDAGAIYFGDERYVTTTQTSHIQSFDISNNLFLSGTRVTVNNGTGVSGAVANRKIQNNVFQPAPGQYWPSINFSGAGGYAWYAYPVGGAVISGNTFSGSLLYIRARGDYLNAQFYWASFWNNNTFDKAVVTLIGAYPPFDVRPYAYDVFTNVRRIGAVIQPDVEIAQTNDTVLVKAATYPEQVTITKTLSLIGENKATTFIKPPATLTGDAIGAALVSITNTASVTMRGFTIAGPKPAPLTCDPAGALMYGVRVMGNGALDLADSNIIDIRDEPLSGCQTGIAIRAGSAYYSEIGHLTMTGIVITGYQKGGVVVSGLGSSGIITANTITGRGAQDQIAQNGVQISGGATATVTDNTISANLCNHPTACSPDPINSDFSSGVLLYDAGAVTVSHNIISDTDTAIYSYAPTTPATVDNNTLRNNRWHGVFVDQGNTTVLSNSIVGSLNGVVVAAFNNNTGNSSAKVYSNTISGATNGVLVIDQSITDTNKPLLDAQYNNLTSNTNGVLMDASADAAASNVNRNNLISNTTGISNAAPSTLNGTLNWWNSANGPGPVALGSGDKVSTRVTYCPWLTSPAPGGTPLYPVMNMTTGEGFCTIQAAIDDSDTVAGNTISVTAGTFTELVTVSKSVTLKGAQSGTIGVGRCDATTNETVMNDPRGAFYITADGVTIDGFVIQGATNQAWMGAGVVINPTTSGHTLRNNVFRDNIMGLYLNSSGAQPTLVENNCFKNNNAEGAAAGNGIYADQGTNNVTARGNTFTGHQNAAILLTKYSTYTVSNLTIVSNTMENDNRIRLTFANGALVSGNVFTNSAVHGVQIAGGSSNITITQNTVAGATYAGVRISDIDEAGANSNIAVLSNTVTGSQYGVWIADPASTLNVFFNTLTGNKIGVQNESSAPATGSLINRNNLSGSITNTLSNANAGILNGECNWFGSSAGPLATTAGNIDSVPWLTSSDLHGACGLGTITVQKVVSGTAPASGDFGFALYKSSAGYVSSFTLTAGSSKTITDVLPGNYWLYEQSTLGYENNFSCNAGAQTINNSSFDVLPNSQITCTATNKGLNSVEGNLWFDQNNDSSANNAEPPLPNVTVTLSGTIGNCNQPTALDPQTTIGCQLGTILTSTVTDANGNYAFAGLPDGHYAVSVVSSTLPAGLRTPTYDFDGIVTPHTASFDLCELYYSEDALTTPSGGPPVVQNCLEGSANFGYRGDGNIGDHVFFDVNGDGAQDAGDLPLAGVMLTLKGDLNGNGATDTLTATTDSAGNYNFANLPSGAFTVTVVTSTLPAGVSPVVGAGSIGANEYALTLAIAQTRSDVDFGYVGNLSVGDSVFYDLNNNGVQDAGDLALPNVTLNLSGDLNGNGQTDMLTATTNAAGIYYFSGVPAGVFTITVNAATLPAGMTPTFDLDGIATPHQAVITLGNAPRFDVDFGYRGSGSIGDLVWEDSNGNGSYDAGEPGLNATLTLQGDLNHDGVVDTLNVSAVNGAYTFANLIPGTFTVTVNAASLPANMQPVFGAGSVGSFNKTLALADAESNTNVDFGFVRPAVVNGRVWLDVNRNGQQDAGEPGLPDVTIKLFAAQQPVMSAQSLEVAGPISTTTSDANGGYSFSGIVPGRSYTMNFALPSGASWTTPGLGDPNTDSDVDANGNAGPFTLTSGANVVLNISAGTTRPTQIAISKTAAQTTVRFGENITYTLVARNAGATMAQNVVITDGLPSEVTFISASPMPSMRSPALTWAVGDLMPGQSFTITLIGNVRKDAVIDGGIRNTAFVNAAQNSIVAGEQMQSSAFVPLQPTAITLASFNAALENNSVRLAWRTALEQNSFGFNVLRSTSGNRNDATQVNAELIPAKNDAGNSYTLADPQGSVNSVYWLQEMDLSGATTDFGPFRVSAPAAIAQPVQQPAQPVVQQPVVAAPAGGVVMGGVPAAAAQPIAQPAARVQPDAPQAQPVQQPVLAQPAAVVPAEDNSAGAKPAEAVQIAPAKGDVESAAAAIESSSSAGQMPMAAPQSPASQPAPTLTPSSANGMMSAVGVARGGPATTPSVRNSTPEEDSQVSAESTLPVNMILASALAAALAGVGAIILRRRRK